MELFMPIGLQGWLSESRENGYLHMIYYVFIGFWYTITSRYSFGTNIFDKEWDLLIVLDACRVDAMREVEHEYDFIDHVDSIWSVGSTSEEWMAQTFQREYAEKASKTAYVSANPYSQSIFYDDNYPPGNGHAPFGWLDWDILDAEDLSSLKQVWKSRGMGGGDQYPPSDVTDEVIKTYRQESHERYIVHYMQPHTPYMTPFLSDWDKTNLEKVGLLDNDAIDETILDADTITTFLDEGKLTHEQVWELYLDNLRFVLEEVGVLVENIDADTVVITADHGELMGELGSYAHMGGILHPNLRKVPWVETKAVDSGDYELMETEESEEEVSLEDHLEALGYR